MNPNSTTVLVVEPQRDAATGLARSLAAHGYAVEIRSRAREVRDLVERRRFAALILSARLPDCDGFALCRHMRRASEAAILMLAAGDDDLDRIVGLESGADDCLARPFVPRELIVRLRGILRRRAAAAAREPLLEFGPLQIDRHGRVVRLNGVEKPLSSLQFALLVAFAENVGRVLRREELHHILTGGDPAGSGRSIDIQVCRLRSQIEDDASCPRRLVTIRGSGYLFDAGVDAGS